jgi:hypothetical protein
MQELPPFIPRVNGQAMTAAERQRRCREGGKGRHRGRYITKAQLQQMLAERAAAAATAAAAPATAGPAAAAAPAAPAAIAAPASPGDIAPRPALAPVHPRFLHWLLAAGH